MKHFANTAAGLAMAAALACAASPAQAAYVVNFSEVGPNVIMTSSGSIDFSGLTRFGTGGGPTTTSVAPGFSQILMRDQGSIHIYNGFSGPTTFGTSAATSAVSAANSHAFLFQNFSPATARIGLPTTYVSGTQLGVNTATFAGSFASLGMTRGTYTWTWGSGANADSLTVNIGTAINPGGVPEPATWALLILGFGAVGGAMRRRQRQPMLSQS